MVIPRCQERKQSPFGPLTANRLGRYPLGKRNPGTGTPVPESVSSQRQDRPPLGSDGDLSLVSPECVVVCSGQGTVDFEICGAAHSLRHREAGLNTCGRGPELVAPGVPMGDL